MEAYDVGSDSRTDGEGGFSVLESSLKLLSVPLLKRNSLIVEKVRMHVLSYVLQLFFRSRLYLDSVE
jgi:hypothetical protein